MNIFIVLFFVIGILYANASMPSKKYYVFTLNKFNWYEAFHDCLSRDLQLATINSANEQFAIEQAMTDANATTELFWLSGTDHAQEGKFVWMSTGRSLTYTKWIQGQPDNAGGIENCLHIWNTFAFGMWNDSNCVNKWLHICEDKPQIKNKDVTVNININ